MKEINKRIIEIYVSQAMLTFALSKQKDDTTKIAKEYAEKIIMELENE